MAKKPTATGGAIVAARKCAIDGVHFAAGDPIEGVDPDQLASALRIGAAIKTDVAEPEGDDA
jgi:hypothetical protein